MRAEGEDGRGAAYLLAGARNKDGAASLDAKVEPMLNWDMFWRACCQQYIVLLVQPAQAAFEQHAS